MWENYLNWDAHFSDFQDLITEHISNNLKKIGRLDLGALVKEEYLIILSEAEEGDQLNFLIRPNTTEILRAIEYSQDTKYKNYFIRQLEREILTHFKGDDAAVISQFPWANNQRLFTSCGIEIDYNSQTHNLNNPEIRPISFQEALEFKGQVEKALTIIKEISEYTYSLIVNFLTTINFRKNEKKANYSSWSSELGIGKIVASNFHYVSSNTEDVIDFLIHETIHSFLHVIEEKHGKFITDAALEQTWLMEDVVTSPWSGHGVNLGAYTHAILVWYGLFAFWHKLKISESKHADISEEVIDSMLESSSSGFHKNPSILDPTLDKLNFIKEDYQTLAATIQNKVLELKTPKESEVIYA